MRLWTIETLDEVASTNAFAKERVQSGVAKHGHVLQARHQTAGRGRIPGRIWHDLPDESVLMSVVIESVPAPPECIQYLAALSTIAALREIGCEHTEMKGLSFRLKWPNDILLGSGVGPDWTGRKICGTLTEAIWQGNTFRSAIVGIGVNVRQQSFEGPLASLATSFNLVGLDISVNEVRDRILDRLEADLTRYSSLGLRQAREEIIHSLRSEFGWMWDGPPMKVSVGISQAMRGMHFEGISDTGALLLRSPEGNLITLHSGSIEPEAGMKSAGLAQDRSEAA